MSRKRQRNSSVVLPLMSRWIIVLILLVLTLAAYWNSFHVPLVFDDSVSIQRNTGVRFGEFSWNLLAARSVLYLTFTLNYLWFGQEVLSYHIVNFFLHFLNGFLILLFAERAFLRINTHERQSRVSAGLAAAFFLVHPVQTESVTYISSRSEILSTNFYLLAILLFVMWPEKQIGLLLSCLVGLMFFFGLGAKETVITLPATIFLYDFFILSGGQFRILISRWRFYVPFIVGGVGAVYYILTKALAGSVGAGLPGHLSTWNYFLTQTRVIVRYIYLVFFPVGLNLDYDFPASNSLLEPAVLASITFLSGILVIGWLIRRRHPVFAFSIFSFFVTLSPTSSFVPILDVIFEHRLYLPLVGVCLSFPIFVDIVYKKAREKFMLPGNARAYACSILLILAAGTALRNDVWADEIKLWTDVAAKSPGKERPYYSIAWAHFRRGEYDQAIEILEKSQKRFPEGRFDSDDFLANMYLKAGRFDAAIERFKNNTKVATDKSLLGHTYNNLGVAYLYKWKALESSAAKMPPEAFAIEKERLLKPAAEAFAKSVEANPEMMFAMDSFINVAHIRGLDRELESQAMEKLEIGEDFDSLYIIGKNAFERGDYARADEYFERAETLRGDIKLLYFNHGYALATLNLKDRAIEKYIQAIRIDPIFIEAHHNVGLIYYERGEYATAADNFAEVLRLDPNHISSNLYLARIYLKQGNKVLARNHVSTVLGVAPGNPQALQLQQQIGL